MVYPDAIWYDIWTCRENFDILSCREHFESNEAKWCTLTLFDTIFGHAENILKAMKLNSVP